ncbi:hypothetical protein PPERSA_06881 [Pseudocohnilembus persalinus]|uniref:Uncharacterized protein n=1 Tax=Pseudocohnilembus persalinus TaxID=266149 RepID=A0A0V0QYE2_PSEPJ|nr:hypothetical protein PPERSA_06881 [Pseudocohnilembus persalinus]|eukprot:KRX07266.1 hypothetical protein PPERSA_06881 [Pseudocohnilembus persalinus]
MKPQAKQTKLIKASDVDDKKEEDDQPFRVEQVEEDQFGRKVWRVVKGEEYLQKEQEEQQVNQDDEEEDDEDEEDNGPTFLQRRTQDLKLDRVVGQRQQVSANEDLRNLGVYNCPVCEYEG